MNNTPIDLPTKFRMAFYSGQQYIQRQIAELTETSKSSVNRVLQLLDKKEAHEVKYDYETQLRYHFVLFQIISNPFITYRQISNNMSKFDFHVSLTSICRITSELNILNKFQKPKEKLTVKQKENRLNFAKNFLSSPFYNLPIVFTEKKN